MDKSDPDVNIVPDRNANSNGWYGGDIDFTISRSDNGPSGIKSFKYCTSTNGTCTPTSTVTSSSTRVTISTESSNNYICAIAIDNADRSTSKCYGPIRVDKHAPTTNTISSLTITQLDTLDLWSGISYSDNLTATASISKTATSSASSSVPGTYSASYSLTDLAGHTHTFTRDIIVNPKMHTVDVNPVINGTQYNAGLAGFTFDVYKDGTLVADNVTDWCESVAHGTRIKVVGNENSEYNYNGGNYDGTITSSTEIRPSWSYSPQKSGGVYIWSDRTQLTAPSGGEWATDWPGRCSGTFSIGTNSTTCGHWTVTVTEHTITVTGTKFPKNGYSYNYYFTAYAKNNHSRVVASGSGWAGEGHNAVINMSW